MNIPWAKPCFWGNESNLVTKAVRSTWISGGPYVEKLEKDFTRYHEARFCITTSNGTSALELSLRALGIGQNDEVIVPGFAFMAAAHMVLGVGAKPVFVDIDRETWCIDPGCVRQKISSKTRAIIAVHNYGNICDMKSLRRLADRHELFLIEDAAEALFSKYKGHLAGTLGDVGCFSFQATKTLTTGEGGCVLTSSRKLFERMRLIRNHGLSQRGRYWHDAIGYNFRLTNIQAALGCAQFKERSKIISSRRKVDRLYRKYLKDQVGIRFQFFSSEVRPVVWCVAIEIDPEVFGATRDQVIKRLGMAGIETRPGFYPPSAMPLYRATRLPVAERISARIISLPSFPSLSEREIRYVCDELRRLTKNRS